MNRRRRPVPSMPRGKPRRKRRPRRIRRRLRDRKPRSRTSRRMVDFACSTSFEFNVKEVTARMFPVRIANVSPLFTKHFVIEGAGKQTTNAAKAKAAVDEALASRRAGLALRERPRHPPASSGFASRRCKQPAQAGRRQKRKPGPLRANPVSIGRICFTGDPTGHRAAETRRPARSSSPRARFDAATRGRGLDAPTAAHVIERYCRTRSCPRTPQRRRAPPRCAAAGCTWPHGRSDTARRF